MRHTHRKQTNLRAAWLSAAAPLILLLTACGSGESGEQAPDQAHIGTSRAALTPAEQACYSDPRVTSGLVPWEVCAGAALFFNETFGGNGRTCASCHPVVVTRVAGRGQAAYRKCKWIAEPHNGWIKHVLGFRQFSLRGLQKCAGEFRLVCLALNLRRMRKLLVARTA